MVNSDWCKNFCPQLAVFNRVFQINGGKGLFPRIVLIGNDEQMDYCISQETEFFTSIGKTVAISEDEPADVYFLRRCPGKANMFDVSGCRLPNDYAEMFAQTGLILKEGLEDELNEICSLSKFTPEEIVNNTILAHYERTTDNVLLREDFAWTGFTINESRDELRGGRREHRKDEVQMGTDQRYDSQPIKKPVRHIVVKRSSPVKKDDGKVSNDKNKDGSQSAIDTEATENAVQNEAVSDIKNDKTEDVTKDNDSSDKNENKNDKNSVSTSKNAENQADKDDVPVPEKKKDKTRLEIRRAEILSKEDIEKNKQELAKIMEAYKNVRDYIKETCDSRWRVLENEMTDMISNKDFGRKQLCREYLEISDDNTTELYNKLYELDKLTQEFNKNVVHKIEHFGCPICGENWDEDVTFLSHGITYIACPKCGAERGYEN